MKSLISQFELVCLRSGWKVDLRVVGKRDPLILLCVLFTRMVPKDKSSTNNPREGIVMHPGFLLMLMKLAALQS